MPIRLPRNSHNDPAGVSRQINRTIDDGLAAERAGELGRDYLGASIIGDTCDRRLAYQYRGDAPAPPDGRALRIFEMGHLCEELLLRWLRIGGFDVRDIDPNTGRRFEFEAAEGRIRGHADGAILGGPDIGIAYPWLWEAKSLNDASWLDLVRRGLGHSKPLYHAQVQTYLWHLGFERCLLSALNKNSGAIYHELILLDVEEAQRLSERAIGIVSQVAQGRLPPRLTEERECRGCSFIDPCRAAVAGVKAATRAWIGDLR